MRKILKIVLYSILALVALGVIANLVNGPKKDAAANTNSTFDPAPADDLVTIAKYSALRDGMKYAAAAKILGRDGEEMSSNNIAGVKTVMYQWKNPDGSNMNAMFQNDKLVQKAQFGLK